MKRVLVTGAGGFLGRHCLAPLLARGYEVHAVSTGVHEASAGVRWHQADLLDGARVRELVAGTRPTHLLHLAWNVDHGRFWTSPENLGWVQGGIDLVRAFVEAGGERVVGAGTCAEYAWDGGICSEASTPLRPATLYGASKLALSGVTQAYAAQAGVSAAWGRIFLLYGPHERAQRLVPSVISSLLRDAPALCSHGRQIRDVLFVQDVADAFVALLDSPVSGAVNVGAGEPTTLAEVVGSIARLLGRESLVRLGAIEAPAGDPAVLTADVGRLRDEVGWRPRYTLEEGLAATIEWWRARADHTAKST